MLLYKIDKKTIAYEKIRRINMSAMLKVKNMVKKGIMTVSAGIGTAMMYATNVFATDETKKVAEDVKKVAMIQSQIHFLKLQNLLLD